MPRAATGDWLLEDVSIYDANMNVVRRLPEMAAMPGLTTNQLTLAKVDPTELNYWTLKNRIAELDAGGRPDDEARAGLAHKIAGPLSTLLMPLLAAVAAFGLARSGQVLLRAASTWAAPGPYRAAASRDAEAALGGRDPQGAGTELQRRHCDHCPPVIEVAG